MELKKRIVTVLVGLVLFVGTAVPKARADGVTATCFYGGGSLIGLGIVCCVCDDGEEPSLMPLAYTSFAIGGLLIVGGLVYGISNDELFAKAEQNPVIQHVRFGTTGRDFSLGAAFKL